MDKQSTKRILFEIMIARERMKYLENFPERQFTVIGLLKQLFNLYEELAKRVTETVEKIQDDHVLVFTEAAPEGVVISRTEYLSSLQFMTKLDRETHVAVDLDAVSSKVE